MPLVIKFRKLSRLTETGLTGHHDDPMPGNGLDDLVFFSKNRQFFIEAQPGKIFLAAVSFLYGCLQTVFQPVYSCQQLLIQFEFA